MINQEIVVNALKDHFRKKHKSMIENLSVKELEREFKTLKSDISDLKDKHGLSPKEILEKSCELEAILDLVFVRLTSIKTEYLIEDLDMHIQDKKKCLQLSNNK